MAFINATSESEKETKGIKHDFFIPLLLSLSIFFVNVFYAFTEKKIFKEINLNPLILILIQCLFVSISIQFWLKSHNKSRKIEILINILSLVGCVFFFFIAMISK